jgi:GTP cyclohydrolase I
MMRGVKKVNASMKTSKMLGAFKHDDKIRREFITHINANS